jgi:hypothetical protein
VRVESAVCCHRNLDIAAFEANDIESDCLVDDPKLGRDVCLVCLRKVTAGTLDPRPARRGHARNIIISRYRNIRPPTAMS